MSTEIMIGKQGCIMSYRRSRHVIDPRFVIIKFPDFNTRAEAGKLIGRIVSWQTITGKTIKGKITRLHGTKGGVAAHFTEGGLPGQALGTPITIVK